MIQAYPIWLVTCEMEGEARPRCADDGYARQRITGSMRYRLPIHAPTAADAITIATLACDGHGRVIACGVPAPCASCRGTGAEDHGIGCGCGHCDGRCIACHGRGYRE